MASQTDRHVFAQQHHFDAEKCSQINNLPIAELSNIVEWLAEVVGPNDPRGFDPRPVLKFAMRYRLWEHTPEQIYEEYVRYQCHVISYAADRLPDTILNTWDFGMTQEWFEQLHFGV